MNVVDNGKDNVNELVNIIGYSMISKFAEKIEKVRQLITFSIAGVDQRDCWLPLRLRLGFCLRLEFGLGTGFGVRFGLRLGC